MSPTRSVSRYIKSAATVALKKKFAKVDYAGKHGKRKFEAKITAGRLAHGTAGCPSSQVATWN